MWEKLLTGCCWAGVSAGDGEGDGHAERAEEEESGAGLHQHLPPSMKKRAAPANGPGPDLSGDGVAGCGRCSSHCWSTVRRSLRELRAHRGEGGGEGGEEGERLEGRRRTRRRVVPGVVKGCGSLTSHCCRSPLGACPSLPLEREAKGRPPLFRRPAR